MSENIDRAQIRAIGERYKHAEKMKERAAAQIATYVPTIGHATAEHLVDLICARVIDALRLDL